MKKKMLIVLLVLVFSLTLAMPTPALSQSDYPFHVKPTPVGNADGSDWDNACSLQYALTNASSGDEIWVAEGIYKPGTDRSDTFLLDSGEKVYGGFDETETTRDERDWVANPTILSGDIGTVNVNSDNSYHVIIGADSVTLDGFTITGGNADGQSQGEHDRGGGMYNKDSSPTVTNCTFYDNSADVGGGMYNSNSSPTVTDCTFEYNSTISAGGGMYNSNSSPTVTNCIFRDNSADVGGGMLNNGSSPTVTNCTFDSNWAIYSGGGMYNVNSSPTVTNCIFSGNSAGYAGGGMYNENSSSPTVTGCIFSGNSASSWAGGGMYNYNSSSPTVMNCVFYDNSAGVGGGMGNDSSSPTVTNCTFYGNSAGEYGGGGVLNLSSSPTLTNCILWNNTPDQIIDYGPSPTVTYSVVAGEYNGGAYPGESNINENPELDENLRLSDTSPAIDAGNNDAVSIDIDLDGNTRIVDFDGDGDAIVDMGAYEKQKVIVLATVDIDPDTLNLRSKGVFTAYITLPEGYNVADIDVSTVQCEGAVAIRGAVDGDVFIAKFDKTSVQEILEVGDEVEIVITGELTDGTSFEGTDTIKVIDKSND